MSRRTKMLAGMVCLALVVVFTVPALGGAVDEQKKARRKLMAYRAARVDGIRKLAERIKGLRITSSTTVQDFVAESDAVETAVNAWLNGFKEVGKPKYTEDGTCEVVMVVKLRTVVATLKQIRNRYYKGSKFKAQDFEEITVTNKFTEIREVGQGAIKEDDPFDEDPLIPSSGGPVFSKLHGPARRYWMAHCTGRGRLMAERAARVDAQRRLAERIKGVRITADTTVQDFVTESDVVNVEMRTWLRGAREIGVRYHSDELIVEVEMQVKLRTVYATVKSIVHTKIKGNNVKMKRLEELILKSKDTIIKETGMGVPPRKYLKDVPPAVVAVMQTASQAPPWITQSLRATGQGALDTDDDNKARAKLMAFRAAELDARRKLSEQLGGLMITSNTSVSNFVAQNDQINTAMGSFQQGVRVIDSSKKLAADGTAQVTVEADLKPLWNMILFYQRKLSITIR